ncbi:unnamed protein product [Ostreobium quekettii]|uniref:Tryptophan/tyrosine permease n=1 Tax=Ostreobium quekettii TaxID=121088 RepID=A0A8S1JCS9_9CHLO|nr:unnamed protein product [Ostreobium quekettii]|eukprot:evm.model.scf_1735.2 EVM.evm.TU.scf_1735.2   scf_1735:24509-26176(-)
MRIALGAKGLPALHLTRGGRPRGFNASPALRRPFYHRLPHLSLSRFPGRPVVRAQKARCDPRLPPRRKDAIKSSDGTLRDTAPPGLAKQAAGSVLGATALITGSTVGAGMLALPAATAGGGFFPSAGIMTVTWGFLILEALLIAEVNLTIMKKQQARGETPRVVTLRQMAAETLGPTGGKVTSYVYLFLSYTLLVAYIAKGSELVNLLSMDAIPASAGGPLFAFIMGAFLFREDTESVDVVNRALTLGLLAVFGVLVAGGASIADWGSLLHHQDWGQAWGALPVVFLSLVFHDLIPVLCNYLGGDKGRVRTAVVAGGVVPLAMFLVWNAVALSLVPGAVDVANAGGIIDPLRVLIESLGPSAGLAIEVFSLLAIATSFIGTMLGFSDYLRSEIKGWEKQKLFDGLVPKPEEGGEGEGGILGDEASKLAAISLALVPPTLAAATSPDLFYLATQVAGGYGITLLYGILPPLMAWSVRPVGTVNQRFAPLMPMVPGGRKVLASITSCAAAIEVGKLAADSSGLASGLATVGSKVGTVTNLVIGDLAAFESSAHLGHW